ncbi:hypothetical protein [Roseibium aestuarii]|uniref:Uncharacterized protein n=1 Tax=Roseibium aestuarii TaxID=2600299 RepID=A0ABW4JYW5_9HYPH|nr:hypothetical protein [Roseibium aestuarii]
MELVAKILNFLGALLLSWPALHMLLSSRAYDGLLGKAAARGQLVGLVQAVRSDFLARFEQAHAGVFLAVSLTGMACLIAGFALDLVAALVQAS